MAYLAADLVPFRVDGDVECVVNRTDDAWLLTVLNHRGVDKLPMEPGIVDHRRIASGCVDRRRWRSNSPR